MLTGVTLNGTPQKQAATTLTSDKTDISSVSNISTIAFTFSGLTPGMTFSVDAIRFKGGLAQPPITGLFKATVSGS